MNNLWLQERDGFKNILESYESELTVNVSKHASSRIQHLEEMVDNYRKQIEHLETDLQKTYPQTGAGRINISQVNN